MADPLKYAHIERERRFLVSSLPAGVHSRARIVDHYVDGTRLRLREITHDDGTVIRKLGQKVRLRSDASEIAHTSLYLDDAEWAVLSALPSRQLTKTRHYVVRDGLTVAIDELEDGTLLAEIDDGLAEIDDGLAEIDDGLAEIDDGADVPLEVPAWLDVIRDVSSDEEWTGGRLAGSTPD